jgi:hypothetical protein
MTSTLLRRIRALEQHAAPDTLPAETVSARQYFTDPLGFVRWGYPWHKPGSPLENEEGRAGEHSVALIEVIARSKCLARSLAVGGSGGFRARRRPAAKSRDRDVPLCPTRPLRLVSHFLQPHYLHLSPPSGIPRFSSKKPQRHAPFWGLTANKCVEVEFQKRGQTGHFFYAISNE